MTKALRPLGDWIDKDAWPHVPCPICGDGRLAAEELSSIESAASARLHDHENWEPDWITGTFQGRLVCALRSCGEVVVVAGDYKVTYDLASDGAWYGDFAEYLRLRYAQPALVVLSCPEGTPESVRAAVAGVSRVLWIDPGAAANRLRLACEELLTAQKVRRFTTGQGRRKTLNTHTRIVEFGKRNSAVGDALMAVKWIGNEGSHADALTATDVLDGAEMFGRALTLLYDTTAEELERRIRRINKAKGVPKGSKP